MVYVIAAINSSGGIGMNGQLPWRLPLDLHYFKEMTKNSTVIMGRKTWDSLPHKPLPGRENIVVTSDTLDDVECCKTIQEAIARATKTPFLIGGAGIYREALRNGYATIVYVTKVSSDAPCDTFVEELVHPEKFGYTCLSSTTSFDDFGTKCQRFTYVKNIGENVTQKNNWESYDKNDRIHKTL